MAGAWLAMLRHAILGCRPSPACPYLRIARLHHPRLRPCFPPRSGDLHGAGGGDLHRGRRLALPAVHGAAADLLDPGLLGGWLLCRHLGHAPPARLTGARAGLLVSVAGWSLCLSRRRNRVSRVGDVCVQ